MDVGCKKGRGGMKVGGRRSRTDKRRPAIHHPPCTVSQFRSVPRKGKKSTTVITSTQAEPLVDRPWLASAARAFNCRFLFGGGREWKWMGSGLGGEGGKRWTNGCMDKEPNEHGQDRIGKRSNSRISLRGRGSVLSPWSTA